MTTTISSQTLTSKLSKADHKLFKGTAAEVHSWMNDREILASIGCDFNVIRMPAGSPCGRTYEDCQLWLRDDNHDLLGFFGNKRQIIQPSLFIDYFRAFCDASDKAISLDVVGSYNKGRSIYMAAKLSGNNGALVAAGGGLEISRQGHSAYISTEDRTDHWLVLSDRRSQAPGVGAAGVEFTADQFVAVDLLETLGEASSALLVTEVLVQCGSGGVHRDGCLDQALLHAVVRLALANGVIEYGVNDVFAHCLGVAELDLAFGDLAGHAVGADQLIGDHRDAGA
jgi:hypothetical protein